MKKFLIATSLLTLTATSAFAATTGNLLLQGRVGEVLSIAVTAEGVASALDLAVSQTNTKVATVNEQSNKVLGYKVTITSANLSKLKRVGGSETFDYSLTYAGSPLTLSSPVVISTAASSLGTNVNKDVEISYTGKPAYSMIEGDYTDTITFDIASN